MIAVEQPPPSPARTFPAFRQSVLAAALLCALPCTHAGDAAGSITDTALAAKSGPRGATMFRRMAADDTGIKSENTYTDPEMWGMLYHEFEVGPLGTGVAIGDYDSDGRPDIFVVSKTESCRLFRNLGNWKFEDVTDKAGVGDKGEAARIWKEGVCFVDVNNDGRLDIYVCRFNAPNLLYINQGNGTFKEMAHPYGLDVVDACVMASFCDYDRDGWLDVFIQTNLLDNTAHPEGRRCYLFHNNRDGTFTDVTDKAGISHVFSQTNSATWWDYDNDGWPDLYVANDFAQPDMLYHNNRDGTFTDVAAQVLPHSPYSSMGSDLGDINNDGLIDFIATDMAATSHEKDQRTMATTRTRVRDPADHTDGLVQYLHNAVYLNTNTAHVQEAAFLAGLAATDWTWSLRFEDLDNDGRLDLFVPNGMHREIHNADLIQRMMRAETAVERVRVARNSPVLAENNLAFRNLGDLRFESVGPAWGLDEKGVSFGAAFGDLDGDGDLDLVYANYQAGPTVLRNDSDAGHRVLFDLRGTVSNRFGIGATVRIETAAGPQVRQLWIARGYMSSSEPVVHFGLGEDSLIKRVTVTWPSGRVQEFDNLAADRRYTITEPSSAPPSPPTEGKPASQTLFTDVTDTTHLGVTAREEQIDELAQQPLLPLRLNRRGPAIAVGDLDGDGLDDLVIGGTTQDPVRVVLSSASTPLDGSYARALGAPDPLNDGPILLLDADGDGTLDVLVTKGGNSLPPGAPEYQPTLWLNDGHGSFRAAPADKLPSLSIDVGAAVAADFEHSGRLGIFFGARVQPGDYPTRPRNALLANRGGIFEDVTDTLAPALREVGMVTSALWSDVDGDGWPDLLVTIEWGEVKYFHNDAGKGFTDWTEKSGFASAGTGWWTAIAAADFNGDGHLDYVVGNVGLNTQYHADAQHPALLYQGDFNGDGGTQLVEAYYEGEKVYPWRTRKDLGSVIPSILKRFPRNDPYAHATLEEIVGAPALASAQRFAATELRSGVLLSQPDGSYRFEPLPRLAQIAPTQGLVAGDFDGDGHADIYAVQNSYAPAPVVGRFDGGISQLFHGDGHGHFAAVPPAESALVVPDDAKALAVLTLDGDERPDFFVTRNNAPSVLFRNNGAPGRHTLRVVLRGLPGNPTAIGARVTLAMTDGTTQTAEVAAGSGYMSQSTPTCLFGFYDHNPPKSIRVRWPAGEQTEQAVSPKSGTITLASPSH